jgi:hypothetical protein
VGKGIDIMSTNDATLWSTAAPYVAALVAAIAVLTAAWISHSAKISEFRQAWINDLRKDISDYVGAAEKWFHKWDELRLLASSDKEVRGRDELFPIANAARVILWRIRLRLNPRTNPNKAQDDRFLQSLDHLLNPGKVSPPNLESSWLDLANDAVEQAREILKREWQVTKRFPLVRRWRT